MDNYLRGDCFCAGLSKNPLFNTDISCAVFHADQEPGITGSKGDRFDALMMSPGSENLSNEIQILTSRPVLQRVIKNIHLTTRYYNIGKVRTSLLYPESPFSLEIIRSRVSMKKISDCRLRF